MNRKTCGKQRADSANVIVTCHLVLHVPPLIPGQGEKDIVQSRCCGVLLSGIIKTPPSCPLPKCGYTHIHYILYSAEGSGFSSKCEIVSGFRQLASFFSRLEVNHGDDCHLMQLDWKTAGQFIPTLP